MSKHKRSGHLLQKHITELVILVLIISGLVVGASLLGQSQDIRSEASTAAVDFEFVPQNVNMTVGEEISVSVFVFPDGEAVTAADLPVVFDNQIFELKEIVTTGLFETTAYGPEAVGNGVWTSVASVPEGVSENGEVLRLTLVAKQPVDNTLVSLSSENTNVAALNRNSSNMLGKVTPAVITVR